MKRLLYLLVALLAAASVSAEPKIRGPGSPLENGSYAIDFDATTEDSDPMGVFGICSVRFTLGSGDSGTATVYECDGPNDATSACTSKASFTSSTSEPVTRAAAQRWWKVATSATTLDDSEMTIDCTRNQLGLEYDTMIDACRSGAKGGGWNEDEKRYDEFVCLHATWSGEVGGSSDSESAWLSTPTTDGGNGYGVTCDGRLDPIPQCRQAGDYHWINANSDMILAQEMSGPNAYLIRHPKPGHDHTFYHVGPHGTNASGTANGMPIARPPRQYMSPRIFTVYGNRQMVGSPPDPDPLDDDPVGAIYLIESGHQNSGTDPAADNAGDGTPVIPRRQMGIGLDADSVASCNATGCPFVADSNNSIPISPWGRKIDLLGDNIAAKDDICVPDNDALGVCAEDPRFLCNSDAGCSNAGLSADCQGFASALATRITALESDVPVIIDCAQENGSRAGYQTWVESVSATTCNTTGLEVTTAGWPLFDNEMDNSTMSCTMTVVDGELYFGNQIRMDGVVSLPGNSRQYRDVAADVPDGDDLDVTKEDYVVVITDDDGSCTASSGVLTGGGSTVSECKWNGTSWSAAACEAGDSDLSGCEDEGTATTIFSGDRIVVSNGYVAKFYHDEGNPILDGNGRHGGRAYLTDMTFYDNDGRITDASHWPIIRSQVIDNQYDTSTGRSSAGALFSIGFVPFGKMYDNVFRGNIAENLVSMGEGKHVVASHFELIGNRCTKGCFSIDSAYSNTALEYVHGHGNEGQIVSFDAQDDEPYVYVHLNEIHLAAHKNFDRVDSWGETNAAILVHDFRSGGGDAADWTDANILIENVSVLGEEEFSGVAFEGGIGNPTSNSTIIEAREKFKLRNLTFDNVNGSEEGITVFEQTSGAEVAVGSHSDIADSAYLPSWEGVVVGGVRKSDNPQATVPAASCTDLFDTGGPPQTSGSPDGNCDSDGTTAVVNYVEDAAALPDGTVVRINDDITAEDTCSHTSGTLTGGGSFQSICKSDKSGDSWSAF